MDAKNFDDGHTGLSLEDLKREARGLVRWYHADGRPFLEKHAPEQLAPFDNDSARIERLLDTPLNVTACFLGHSGIGKSTLLNALAAGRDHILPSGGIGPLTALATEVAFNISPRFAVRYHKRPKLWQLVFGLERSHQTSTDQKESARLIEIPPSELDDEARQEIEGELEVAADSDETKTESRSSSALKQAKQIVTGDQFGDRSRTYLIDALRTACGYKPQWDTVFEPEDFVRIERVCKALELAESGSTYERNSHDGASFTDDLKDHAAGFLAPLVEEIEVGWPSDMLMSGITLVDLPGVGISGDTYRQVTQKYIRNKARAVILAVDRAGPTAETVDLLRSSGYWDRLVGAADDPNSDPCKLLIVVTKVDDVASEEYRNAAENTSPRPKRREIYAKLVVEFQSRMKAQIAEQLGNIAGSSNLAVDQARSKAREIILENLEIHPVSAPEYRKILLDDEDDPPFLKSEDETGILKLRLRLIDIAREERATLTQNIVEVRDRLREGVSAELKRLEGLWRDRARAAAITEALERELEEFVQGKRRERDLRVGAFREFLDTTSQTRIRHLVSEAREVAEEDVTGFLKRLRHVHWATLRAAVRRGGAFVGTRAINLPEDIAGYFQEPMAGVWSTKLLTEMRKRTSEFAVDQAALVDEICDWAIAKTASESLAEILDQQKQKIVRDAARMNQIGKEAVGDLRQTVKTRIMGAVRKPIKRACEKFVEDGDDIGRGVKDRVLHLFEDLAKQATKAAEKPAVDILEESFSLVRADIKSAFDDWGDPIQQTSDLILQREKQEIEQKSQRERDMILAEITKLLDAADMTRAVPEHRAAHG